MTDEVLLLENISYDSQKAGKLIDNVSLRLCHGEVFWVVGPQGSGKTTLLEIVIKQRQPTKGEGFFLKQPLFRKISLSRQTLRQQIGILLQDDLLIPNRTVLENVMLPLTIAGINRQASQLRASEAIRQVGLIGKIQASASDLTPEEARATALAQVLAKEPPLILADLNSCEFDRQIVVPHLLKAATYGSAVMIFCRQRPHEVPLVRKNLEVSLA